MRFATLLFSCVAAFATFAAGNPVPDASALSLVPTGGDHHPASFESVVGAKGPSTNAQTGVTVFGHEGETGGVSKRSDFNPLEERASATLILCSSKTCSGKCYGYSLNAISFNKCYASHSFNSVYVSAGGGLGYGAYVGHGCRGVLIPHVRTCYHITPTGNNFFKKH